MFPRVHWRGWANSKAAALQATCSLQVTAFISDPREGGLLLDSSWHSDLKNALCRLSNLLESFCEIDKNLSQPSLLWKLGLKRVSQNPKPKDTNFVNKANIWLQAATSMTAACWKWTPRRNVILNAGVFVGIFVIAIILSSNLPLGFYVKSW